MKEKNKINYYSNIKKFSSSHNSYENKKYNVKLSNDTINKIIDDYF